MEVPDNEALKFGFWKIDPKVQTGQAPTEVLSFEVNYKLSLNPEIWSESWIESWNFVVNRKSSPEIRGAS